MSLEGSSGNGFFYVLEEPIRIIFVDDDPIMREFASVHLATDQGEVVTAADGVEALEAVARQDFDLMLLDLEMPRMDGFEALAELRANDRTRHLPIVVVTGREDVGAIDRAFQAGATSFLVKPINWRLLTYQIRYVRRASRAEARKTAAETRETEQAARSHEALRKLAQDGAEMLALAMKGDPDLRRVAMRYASRLDEAIIHADGPADAAA